MKTLFKTRAFEPEPVPSLTKRSYRVDTEPELRGPPAADVALRDVDQLQEVVGRQFADGRLQMRAVLLDHGRRLAHFGVDFEVFLKVPRLPQN